MFAAVAYLLSPAWSIAITTDDDGVTVTKRNQVSFQVAWSDIEVLVIDAASNTCFIDTGSPDTSILVPGPGAPAGYDVEDKAELIAELRTRVPAETIREVESLRAWRAEGAQ